MISVLYPFFYCRLALAASSTAWQPYGFTASIRQAPAFPANRYYGEQLTAITKQKRLSSNYIHPAIPAA